MWPVLGTFVAHWHLYTGTRRADCSVRFMSKTCSYREVDIRGG